MSHYIKAHNVSQEYEEIINAEYILKEGSD
jgi:hypothetical protein